MTKTSSLLFLCAALLLPPLYAASGCAKDEACSDSANPVSPFLEAARKAPVPAAEVKAKAVSAAAPRSEARPAAAPVPVPQAAETPAPAAPAGSRAEAFAKPLWSVFAGLGLLALYFYLRERPGRKERKVK